MPCATIIPILLTQEIELGLPYRFGVAAENETEAFRGQVQAVSASVEMRYALSWA